MTAKVRVSLEQIHATAGRRSDNESLITKQAGFALQGGADIVVFPELASSGYTTDRTIVAESAQGIDGPLVDALIAITARHRGIVVVGLCERDGSEIFNTVVAVGADGPVLRYRKVHLFDREPDVFTAGDEFPVARTEHGTLGICICYDLRFVEAMRLLALQGADIVLAPAAWVRGFDAHVPDDGLHQQASAAVLQANLNQVAVVAVSQVSDAAAGTPPTMGGSVAVDAYGDVLVGPLSREQSASAEAVLDLDAIRAAQVRGERIRPRVQRRTDVYRLSYGPPGDETLL